MIIVECLRPSKLNLRGRRGWFCALSVSVLIIVGAAVYSNSLDGRFFYDDRPTITDNPQIRGLWPLWRALTAPAESAVYARPVVAFSLALNYALGGLDVRGYHVFNIAVHILCAAILFLVIQRTLRQERLRSRFGRVSIPLALSCTLLWLVHPLQTQCVNYISHRTESVMALFFLLTLYCSIRSNSSARPAPWQIAAVGFCALGMASKQVMVTAPLIVVIYDAAFESDSLRVLVRRRGRFYAALAATWVILVALQARFPHVAVGFTFEIGPLDYALNQCWVILHYLRLTIWPHPLVIDYGVASPLKIVSVLRPAAGLIALSGATLVAVFRWPSVGFLGVWFFLILAPTSSFLPIPTEVAAERRMYLPLAAPIVLFVVGGYFVADYFRSRIGFPGCVKWLLSALVVAVALPLGAATIWQNRWYRSPVSLLQTAVNWRSDNFRAHYNLGNALRAEGKVDEAILQYREALKATDFSPAHNNLGLVLASQGKMQEAIQHFQKAVEVDPQHISAHNNLGVALKSEGRIPEAIEQYEAALRKDPNYAPARVNLGVALMAIGKSKEAINQYREALRTMQASKRAHYNLGVALQSEGKLEEAIEEYVESLKIDPTLAEAHLNLGASLQLMGKRGAAIAEYHEALRLEPNSVQALTNLAWLLITDSDSSARDLEKAIGLVERAAEITKKGDPQVLITLADVYSAAGRFGDAIESAREGLRLATAVGNERLAAVIRTRLKRYEKAKAR